MHVTKIGPGIGLETHEFLMSFLIENYNTRERFVDIIGRP